MRTELVLAVPEDPINKHGLLLVINKSIRIYALVDSIVGNNNLENYIT